MAIDDEERRIIEILSRNARSTFTEIARELGITDVAVKKRLTKLEQRGVIKGYTVIVDPEKLGYKNVALIGVDTEPDKILEVARRLAEKKYSKNVYLTTGDHMIMVEVWAGENGDMMRIIEEIGKLEGVKKVCPAIVLEKIK